jgi:hypothetical protein
MNVDISSIRDLSAFYLYGMADVAGPDDNQSPGARFLTDVRGDFLKALEYGRFGEDAGEGADSVISELADSATPVHTAEVWAVFTDLALYQDDAPDEIDDMTDAAKYMICTATKRLLRELLDMLRELEQDAAYAAESN